MCAYVCERAQGADVETLCTFRIGRGGEGRKKGEGGRTDQVGVV